MSIEKNKSIREKQLKQVEKLKKMSDKLLVDRKVAQQQSEREMKEDDRQNSNYSSSSSTGDIFI